MKSNSELIADFNRNMSRFYETTTSQRNEIYLSYQYRDCNQHSNDQDEKRPRNKLLTVVNIAAPIVRAVAGSEVMSAATIDYVATDPAFDKEADVISDAVEWCQYASDYYAQRAIAAEDAATCGIGAIVTYLDMTKKDFIAGVPNVERIAPMFLTYDKSPRGSQMNRNMRWCGYADPISSNFMDDYIEANKEEKGEDANGATDWRDYILSYCYVENQEDVEFIYHYFWREYVDLYDVKNPFTGGDSVFSEAVLQDETVANIIGKFADDNALNWQADWWTLDKDSFDELKMAVETIQLLLQDMRIPDIESSKRKGVCYYRAQFARGQLLKKSRSYTQNGHALNVITGYYEESTGNFYGMMRPLSFIQDYLNITMSDLLDYTRRASHGGSAYVSFANGSGDAIERIAKAKANEDDLTPVPEGTNITPKSMPQTAEYLTSFIRLMMELMPRVLGLGQEFFGIITSGDMTDSLYGKVMKQSFAVLENWKNSSANADLHQGYIFEDLVRLMADANDGMILPVMSSDNEAQTFINLSKQSLARNYAIRIIERPMTKDERQDTFNKLSQLLPQLPPDAQARLAPALISYANIDQGDKKKFIDAITPQPQQPDPIDVATREATVALTQAEAQRSAANAEKAKAETMKLLQALQYDEASAVADIEKTISGTELDKARAAKEVSDIQNAVFDSAAERINRLINPNQG